MGDIKPDVQTFEETTILNDKGINLPVVRVVFNLLTSVENTIFEYITQEESEDHETPEIQIEPIQKLETKIVSMVPVYNFYAAAGSFSEMQSNKDYTLTEIDGVSGNLNDYFACKVIGESMNRVIPNGALCLFKKYSGGSRNGKIVLLELLDIQDQDFNSAFTVKTYASRKQTDSEGSWNHEVISLIPNSFDSSYNEIILNEDESASYRVVGEFVKVLG
jgi:phage repressor protein C with HTH and peptisase S24 domain